MKKPTKKSLINEDGTFAKSRKTITLSFAEDDLVKANLEKGRPVDVARKLKDYLNFDSNGEDNVHRLAFEVDPLEASNFAQLYKQKVRLIPDELLKRISIQDDLVAAIVNTRSSQIGSFGRQQVDRFSTGFRVEAKPGVLESMDQAKADALIEKFNKLAVTLSNCGDPDFGDEDEKMNLSQFLGMCARDAVVVGRFAVEIIYGKDESGEDVFNSFRPVDASTIFPATNRDRSEGDKYRQEAASLLANIKNLKVENFDPIRFENDQYKWWQVINNSPRQPFTSKELVVYNVYPVTDTNLGGFPVTPLDTVINAVTTHLNITNHNKMYFQTGRAAKGILIIQSADIDPDAIKSIRQQFHASINSVHNAWRLPVFGVGPEDKVTWQNINSGASDMEFQYLSDQNARVILSAFQMSPDELPGYAHLSRGTNTQSLSESNNEFKLEAARDVGIRPLLSKFQDFFNTRLLPIIDPELAKYCWIRFVGLDAETPEKESVRLQQDGGVHMTYNEILAKVDKDLIDRRIGADIPLNEAFRGILDAYFTVGEVLQYFCGIEGASQNPDLMYRRDSWWFQHKQLELQNQQLRMQQQQMQAQAQAQQQQAQQQPQPGQAAQPQGQEREQQQGEVGGLADRTMQALGKSEKQLDAKHLGFLQQQEDVVKGVMSSWEAEAKEMVESILKKIDSKNE